MSPEEDVLVAGWLTGLRHVGCKLTPRGAARESRKPGTRARDQSRTAMCKPWHGTMSALHCLGQRGWPANHEELFANLWRRAKFGSSPDLKHYFEFCHGKRGMW